MSYIKKEPLCAWLSNMCVSENIIKAIENDSRFPPADVVEVRHGEWKCVYDGFHDITEIVCSCCSHTGQKHFNYCVYCGAKMDGKRRENG
jgi:hypothetical protein